MVGLWLFLILFFNSSVLELSLFYFTKLHIHLIKLHIHLTKLHIYFTKLHEEYKEVSRRKSFRYISRRVFKVSQSYTKNIKKFHKEKVSDIFHEEYLKLHEFTLRIKEVSQRKKYWFLILFQIPIAIFIHINWLNKVI